MNLLCFFFWPSCLLVVTWLSFCHGQGGDDDISKKSTLCICAFAKCLRLSFASASLSLFFGVLVGLAISDDLSGTYIQVDENLDQLLDDGTLPLDTLATGFMTVVSHSLTSRVDVLLTALPIKNETKTAKSMT